MARIWSHWWWVILPEAVVIALVLSSFAHRAVLIVVGILAFIATPIIAIAISARSGRPSIFWSIVPRDTDLQVLFIERDKDGCVTFAWKNPLSESTGMVSIPQEEIYIMPMTRPGDLVSFRQGQDPSDRLRLVMETRKRRELATQTA